MPLKLCLRRDSLRLNISELLKAPRLQPDSRLTAAAAIGRSVILLWLEEPVVAIAPLGVDLSRPIDDHRMTGFGARLPSARVSAGTAIHPKEVVETDNDTHSRQVLTSGLRVVPGVHMGGNKYGHEAKTLPM